MNDSASAGPRRRPGEHICPLYDSRAEQVSVAVSFLKEGLARQERCIALVGDARGLLERLLEQGVLVDDFLESGALELWTPEDLLDHEQKFNPAHALARLARAEDVALENGFSGVRIIDDMGWALDARIPARKLVVYERLLNSYVTRHGAAVLCQYDRRRWDQAIIHDVLRTHPVAIVGDMVCPNPYYEPANLEARESDELKRTRAEWWIRRLREGREAERGRERAVAELTRQKERMRLILNSTFEGIYGVDLESRCTFANTACARMLGASQPSELYGLNMHEATHHTRSDGSAHPESECTLHKCRRAEGEHLADEMFWRLDGAPLNVECFSLPMTEDGRTVGSVVTFFDISSRKQLEEQLRQSQKLEAIGRISAGVAHDFNNMLSVILAYCELLLSPAGRERNARAMVEEIFQAGRRGAALVKQLLVFARKQQFTPKDVDLNGVIRSMEGMIRQVIGERIRLELRLSPDVPVVHADPTQIEQVVLNLVLNARDAMPHGGALTIETARSASVPGVATGKTWARLSVSDTGLGMTEDIQRRLYEPFFTTKPPEKGTGLGLAVVQSIVEQSGGVTQVESDLGVGTSFKIYIPGFDEPSRPQDESAAAPPIVPGRRETLLVVEDNESVRAMLAKVLSTLGYTVLAANNGSDALEKYGDLADARIDMLVTDVAMPGINGIALAQHFLALRPQLRVLYLSGHVSANAISDAVQQGGARFLQKPFSVAALAAAVREALASPRPNA